MEKMRKSLKFSGGKIRGRGHLRRFH